MDWTIVASVLVALLLWPVVLVSVGALVFLPVAAVLRGRFHRLIEQKMAHCRQIFNSWEPATARAGPAAPDPCPCGEPLEGR